MNWKFCSSVMRRHHNWIKLLIIFSENYHNLIRRVFYSLFNSLSLLALSINLRCFILDSDENFEDWRKCVKILFICLRTFFITWKVHESNIFINVAAKCGLFVPLWILWDLGSVMFDTLKVCVIYEEWCMCW